MSRKDQKERAENPFVLGRNPFRRKLKRPYRDEEGSRDPVLESIVVANGPSHSQVL